jgi:putative PIN family toxin of toxin-antitoxin system
VPGKKAAIDTVVVWSGLAFPERPFGAVLQHWYDGDFELICSDETLGEYRDVLLRAEYLEAFGIEDEVNEFLTLVNICGIHVEPEAYGLPAISDPGDVKWLAAAAGARPSSLVTVDKAFLESPDLIRGMREMGVDVLNPRTFLVEIER